MSDAMRWFKFYDDVLYDPKVQRLPKDVAWNWVNILCLASKNGGNLPPIADIAFALRITDREADALIETLMAVGLIDDAGGEMRPHNWDERQGIDGTNAERQRRFRERKKAERYERYGNAVTRNDVTALDKIREEEKREERGAQARSLIFAKMIFPEDGSIEFCRWAEIARKEAPGRDVDAVASAFRGFCRMRDIAFDKPAIEKTFTTFCQKLAKRSANA